jgi:pyruvate dehydrogenase E2 component (dihydrolipoamide acetyltransferase)
MEALSPTMEEGQVVKWLKAEGDPVANGDILAEIETDKATMELVARGEGSLRRIFVGEGATVPVGDVIAVVAADGEDIADLEAQYGGARAKTGPVEALVDEGDEAHEAPPPAPGGSDASSSEMAPIPEASSDSQVEPPPDEGARLKASPLARRMAADGQVDLRLVQGTGPGGRITKRDVEAAQAGPASTVPASESGPSAPTFASPPPSGADFEDVQLSQMRKTIAKRLVESMSPIPHFFLRITVDMTRILEARTTVNGLLESKGVRVSINDFILKATAQALARHPEVNAHWNGDSVRKFFRVHIGVAVAVEDGLITPVVRDADRKGMVQISQEVRELAARGREKKLLPEEYTGSTFSVSNLGMFGIQEFTGVINPPEAGILAIGGVEDTPVVVDGQMTTRPLLKVTMSCDHRVIDGATGARFLQTLKGMLEEPAAILL